LKLDETSSAATASATGGASATSVTGIIVVVGRERFALEHDDVAPTVGKQVHFGDFGDTADAARRQCALGDTWHAA